MINDVVKQHDGIEHISVKVHATLTKTFDDTKAKAKFKAVATRDAQLKLVVRPRKWKMNEQEGIAFRAAIIVLVDDISVDDIM